MTFKITPKQSEDTTERVIDQPEALDMILKYIIDKYGERVTFRQIKRDVFPTQEPITIIHLSEFIINFNGHLVDGHINDEQRDEDWKIEGTLKANALTKQFLQRDGGFVKWFANQKEKEQIEQTERDLSRQALTDQIRTNSLTRKISIWAFIISAVALLATIGQLIASYTQP